MKHLLADAERVAKGAGRPSFTKSHYESAMLDLAKLEVRSNETTTACFARLCEEGDERMTSLYTAGYQADIEKVLRSGERISKVLSKRQRLEDAMQTIAQYGKREGETVEQAMARLLEDDVVVRDAYELYCETEE